jgi:hypothetical protein
MKTYLLWYGTPTEAGETIDLPDAVALAYIRTGQAELVEPEKQIEAATIAPPVHNAMRNPQPQLKRR